ncbi:sigma factor-like helix-turn-helix DNA-binding protein [Tsukamurella strandjordii]|uniref:sigma factor-like helix-turn-helix DNA-binding protein n=1 Tax=Tsukamurella TaxID=2060 RepID=UPI001C7DB4FF|nr:sigma factor-like helix-turn-helix DNA-binding protein [Tsukamurella sp. TY48]GIZ97146.1 hypothetical protein TTY48_17580 [Tsukamurella sp. TY48]
MLCPDPSEPSHARASVDRLPRELRTVLLLRIVAGLSVTRCAEVLQLTEEEVRWHQHRALDRLRANFSDR